MGARNRDRFSPIDWRSNAETVGQMLERRWDVMTKCTVCALMMRTDLALIIKVSGPDVSLWNRRQPCKRIGCQGMVMFMARPPGSGHHFQLEAEWPPGRPAQGSR